MRSRRLDSIPSARTDVSAAGIDAWVASMLEKLLELGFDSIANDQSLVRLLGSIAAEFDCESAVVLYCDICDPKADVICAFGPLADAETYQRYLRDFATMDPAPAAMSRRRLCTACSTDLLFADTMEKYSDFLQGFYHPIGLAGALGGPLLRSRTRTAMVAVHRGSSRSPFDERDCRRFEQIMPVLKTMLKLKRLFFEISRSSVVLADAIDCATTAMIIVDGKGILRQANKSAREIIARGDGLLIDADERARALDRAANKRLQVAISECGQGSTTFVRVPRKDNAPYILRIKNSGSKTRTILISDPVIDVAKDLSSFADALGLKPASAKLVAALMHGETLGDFAARTSMSRNTLKYHLTAAFRATGTRRQNDLLRYATIISRDLGL